MFRVTLEQILGAREDRWHRQMLLLQKYPDCHLISLTIVVPGPQKRNPRTLKIAGAAVKALRKEFSEGFRDEVIRDLETGFEALFVLPDSVEEIKRRCCQIEESHPLGRLFDIDVIDRNAAPVDRKLVGLPPRRCLLCDKEARYCMRNHTHPIEDILVRINQMTDDYDD